jgi:membrane-associated phospholipid phosphatase
MRTSEWIQAGFAILLALAAWIPIPRTWTRPWSTRIAPLSARRRWAVTLLALFAVVAILLARAAAHRLTPKTSLVLRDWLPVALMLVPYWQTGQFFVTPDEKIQARLSAIDKTLLGSVPAINSSWRRTTRQIMEWAYMMCYPLVPLGLGVLYATGLRRDASTFWFLVLVPTYICYATTPFFPALPPRSLGGECTGPIPNRGRVMNLWILKHGSIQAISFPSAHVASSLAVSLVLLRAVPAAGFVFLIITFWIAVAAVVGGYHYAIDVILGAALTLVIFAAWFAHLIPSTLITALAAAFAAPL